MLYSLSDWAEHCWWGTFIRDSYWVFACVAVLHLFGLVLLLGGILGVSLRLLGLMLKGRPVSQVARALHPWTLLGLVLMLASGISIWASAARQYYESPPFQLKMEFLVVAIIFHFSLYRWVTGRDNTPWALRGLTGLVALFLWFGVGVLGRTIGFY